MSQRTLPARSRPPPPPKMRPGTLLALFCCSALLLFADRGVIGSNSVNGKQAGDGSPGYGIQVGFTADDAVLGCRVMPAAFVSNTSSRSTQGEFDLSLAADGLLAAAVMVGLMVSAPACAQLSRRLPALRLIGAGLRCGSPAASSHV